MSIVSVRSKHVHVVEGKTYDTRFVQYVRADCVSASAPATGACRWDALEKVRRWERICLEALKARVRRVDFVADMVAAHQGRFFDVGLSLVRRHFERKLY